MDNNQPNQPTSQPTETPVEPPMEAPASTEAPAETPAQPAPEPAQPTQGQPMNQPMPAQQPMMQPMQPMQPAPQPMPKQPMDPAKKKKIILWSTIGGGVAVLAIIAAILVPVLLRVDYGPAYKMAKDLKPKLYDIYYSYDCGYVTSYVSSTYTSAKSYDEYINGCLEVFDTDADALVAQLGETAAVKRNSEISTQFQKFDAEYLLVSAGSTDELENKLDLYRAWHNFVVAVDDLSYSGSSDAEFQTAAKYLTDSGNETFKTYGEGWLEQSLAVASAYRAYRASTTNWSAAYDAYRNKYNEMKDWVDANKPDITDLVKLNFSDASKMYSEFTKLYDLISATYEKNYNSGSGDCTEFLGEVYCD